MVAAPGPLCLHGAGLNCLALKTFVWIGHLVVYTLRHYELFLFCFVAILSKLAALHLQTFVFFSFIYLFDVIGVKTYLIVRARFEWGKTLVLVFISRRKCPTMFLLLRPNITSVAYDFENV